MTHRLAARLDKLEAKTVEDWGAGAALELANSTRHREILDALCAIDGLVSEGSYRLERWVQAGCQRIKVGSERPQERPCLWRWYRADAYRAKLQEPIFGAGRGVLRHADLILDFGYHGLWEDAAPGTLPDNAAGQRDRFMSGHAVCLIEAHPFDARAALKNAQTIRRVLEKDLSHSYYRFPAELERLIMCVITNVVPSTAVLRAFSLNRVRCLVMPSISSSLEIVAGAGA